MKLLLLTDGVFPFVIGGMQKHSHYLTKFLVQQGHQITLVHCVPYNKTLPSHEELCTVLGIDAQSDFKSICLRFPKPGQQPGHYIQESYAYSELIYKEVSEIVDEFDFIYAKGFCAWKMLHLKSKGKKFPPIGVKFHGYEMFQKPVGFKAWLQALILRGPVKWNNRNADFVFSYGGKITDLIRNLGVQQAQIVEIPTGIDLSWIKTRFRPTVKSDIHFVFVGRYERRKGIEELHDALRQLQGHKGFHFHFIGPIPVSKKINAAQFTYHGTLDDTGAIQSILDMCDVLVVPSHSEGMPNVIMEGMARGLAIIATDVGAVSAVVDSANGWFVEPGNAAALKSTLEVVLDADPASIDQKKSASLSRIETFSWDKIARITAEFLESKR
ncbi:MAG: glycosyltransferase family 4 protein [Flavobacteriales bacterium]